jgi:hypothetical protein
MGHITRIVLWSLVTVANAVLAVIYYQGIVPIHEMVVPIAPTGPAGQALDMVLWAVPVAIAIIELGVTAILLYGPVEEEKARAPGGFV